MADQVVACTDRSHREEWRVLQRFCNYSAFNGYRRTPSLYSLVRCLRCGRRWRTKARYVFELPDATPEEATRRCDDRIDGHA